MKARYVVSIVFALAATLVGLWYLLAELLYLPLGMVLILFAPTALVTILASIYGYHTGSKRLNARTDRPLRMSAAAGLIVISAIALAVGALALELASSGRWIAAAAVTVAEMVIVGVAIARQKATEIGDPIATRDAMFERRFRYFVFGLLVAIPVALSLVFFVWYYRLEEGVVFLLIGVATAAWTISKVMKEARDNRARR